MAEKEFSFTRHPSPGLSQTVIKKESELSQNEKDILLGQLISCYARNTNENKIKFLQMVVKDEMEYISQCILNSPPCD